MFTYFNNINQKFKQMCVKQKCTQILLYLLYFITILS